MSSGATAFLDRVRPSIEAALDRLLPPSAQPPYTIHEAMRYSIFAGGKRLRPALCLAGYALLKDDAAPVLPIASAIEMIHTYSLIHDDLPAMDDDDYRRGRPSSHRKFGEATAILAGDALLTLAFETCARCDGLPPDRLIRVIGLLGAAAGSVDGMIAGQVLDIRAEGQPIEDGDVEAIHRRKTAALISVSVLTGAFLAGATEDQLIAVREYGDRIGLGFQVVDDILDETASREDLGKTAGKDRSRQKATYPAAYGLDRSREIVNQLTAEARAFMAPFGDRGAVLVDLATFLEHRSH